MGGIFYINNQRDNYLLHDIWLLPGQMIPEHWHVQHEDVAPKMEAWLVRHGMAYIYGEGDESPGVADRIPPSHKDCLVAKNEKETHPGEVVRLEKALMKHWMMAGPEGAIVTEVATYHTNDALRFSHPGVKL
jgi:D-lyxose ketol-isomerase